MCRYRFFDLGQIPKGNRDAALNLELEHWAPYSEAESYIAWDKDRAMVWFWDAAAVHAAMRDAGVAERRAVIIPESLLRPPADRDIAIQPCLEGVEGQAWQGGVLVASRWWPAPPSADEWCDFRRERGIAEEVALPAVSPAAPLLARPWLASGGRFGGEGAVRRLEHVGLTIAAVVLAAPTLWYGAQIIKTYEARQERSAQLRELETRAAPVMSARRQALQDFSRVKELRQLDPYPPQLVVMAEVAGILPADGVNIREWDYQAGKLKITLAAPTQMSAGFYVKALEAAPYFRNVAVQSGADGKVLNLELEVVRAGCPKSAPSCS